MSRKGGEHDTIGDNHQHLASRRKHRGPHQSRDRTHQGDEAEAEGEKVRKGSGQTWGPEPHISDYAMGHHENGIDSQRGVRARNGGQRMVRLAVLAHRRMRHRQRRLRAHRRKEGLT